MEYSIKLQSNLVRRVQNFVKKYSTNFGTVSKKRGFANMRQKAFTRTRSTCKRVQTVVHENEKWFVYIQKNKMRAVGN